jgi:hypothetical protein
LNFTAGLRKRVAVKKWKCGFRRVVDPQALLIIIFSFAPAAPALEGAAAAASGSNARRFRNDRRIPRSDLTRKRPHRPIYFEQISATSSLASWFGLFLRFRLSGCTAVAVKQNAVRSQIADQRVQVVSQLLIVQKSRNQAFALCSSAEHFTRVIDRILQIVSCFFCGCHCGIRLFDDSVQLLRGFCQRSRSLV